MPAPELTQELIDKISYHITHDWLSPASAAALEDVGDRRLRAWLDEAAADEASGRADQEGGTMCSMLARAMAKSQAVVECTVLGLLRANEQGGRAWTRFAWYLERRYPGSYSMSQSLRILQTVEIAHLQLPGAQADSPQWLVEARDYARAVAPGHLPAMLPAQRGARAIVRQEQRRAKRRAIRPASTADSGQE